MPEHQHNQSERPARDPGWQNHGQVMDRYRTDLKELAQLLPDWDSYGAASPDPGTLLACETFLQAVIAGAVTLVPMPDGGVQIEWHESHHIEIEFRSVQESRSGKYGEVAGFWEPRV